LIRKLGPEHVMGVAVGNELDLFQWKDPIANNITEDCLRRLWGFERPSYYFDTFLARQQSLDGLPGFQDTNIPLTAAFSGFSIFGDPFFEANLTLNLKATETQRGSSAPAEPSDNPDRLVSVQAPVYVNTLLTKLTGYYGRRFAFTLNIYPYFDPTNSMDTGSATRCTRTLYRDLSFGTNTDQWGNYISSLIYTATAMRTKMAQLNPNYNFLFWVGEYGWSYPMASTLHTFNPPMSRCTDFNSPKALVTAYEGFMHWDLKLPYHEPADHVFYFTMRDALNFGDKEHFGLIDTCESDLCKLRCNSESLASCPNSFSWQEGRLVQTDVIHNIAFEACIGVMFISIGLVVSVFVVRSRKRMQLVHSNSVPLLMA